MNEDEENYEENYEEYTYDRLNHYSAYFGGNASEYIVPRKGMINITSHQMGSGIYGVSDANERKRPHYKDQGVEKYTFKMEQPFVIDTQNECDAYIQASTHLSDNLEKMAVSKRKELNQVALTDIKETDVNFQSFIGEVVLTSENFLHLADNFIRDINIKEFDRMKVAEAIAKFWHDYWHRIGYVEMPINYILRSEGFDGVMSNPITECNRWNKGDVKFLPHYPTGKPGDVQPINRILARVGTEKIPFCIGYELKGEMWVKPSFEAKTNTTVCRKCDKIGHAAWRCPV